MNKLYKLMNWPEIEGIVYSDSDHPHHLLGPHKDGKNIIFQRFRDPVLKMPVQLFSGNIHNHIRIFHCFPLYLYSHGHSHGL